MKGARTIPRRALIHDIPLTPHTRRWSKMFLSLVQSRYSEIQMQYIYVRAPGPGAVIRLLERFASSHSWSIEITPADSVTGYRCVSVTGANPSDFAVHLSMSLSDTVFIIDIEPTRVRIASISISATAQSPSECVIAEKRINAPSILRNVPLRSTLKQAGLPTWVCRLPQLRKVRYETVAVLDQRDLLVEAPDVVFVTEGNVAE